MQAHTESPLGEPVRRFDADQDRLKHQYPADTFAPYELLLEPGAPVPVHIDRAVRARYAHPSTVNHDAWRAEHRATLATPGIAPGPRLPRRRRINWWSLLAGIAAATFIGLSIVGTVAILQQIAER